MQKLFKTVQPENLHDWFDLEFTVPEGTVELLININCPGKVHVMLYDPYSYKGMLDKDKSEFSISEARASKGFLKGLRPGLWKIKLEILSVPQEMTVEIGIETKYAQKKWYAGDFHTHTDHSDGEHTIDEAIMLAKSFGLDFIVLADHNVYSQNNDEVEDFVLMPGLELTTPKGHVNVVGVKRPFKSFDYSHKEALYKMFDEAIEAGSFVSVNHPFIGDRWLWGFEMNHHAIEIWNGTPLSRNEKALEWWQEKLSEGKKILATGGSDVHKHDLKGRCYGRGRTLVLADSLSRKHILEGLHRGNICVAASEKSSFLDFKIGQTRIGETHLLKDESQLKLEIDLDLKEDCQLKLYSDTGLMAVYNLSSADLSKNLLVPVGNTFYRLELWGMNNNDPFFTNPIYISKQ